MKDLPKSGIRIPVKMFGAVFLPQLCIKMSKVHKKCIYQNISDFKSGKVKLIKVLGSKVFKQQGIQLYKVCKF